MINTRELEIRLLASEARQLSQHVEDFIHNLERYTDKKEIIAGSYGNCIRLFLSHYRKIRERAAKLFPEISDLLPDFEPQFSNDIVEGLTELVTQFQPTKGEMIAKLKLIATASRALAEALESLIKPHISSDEYDKLASLKNQVENLRDFNLNLYKHLIKAIEEYENGHYLASSLISGKIIQYIHDKLCSLFDAFETVDKCRKRCNIEKVLRKMANILGLNEKKFLKESIEANKLARNYFTHDINAIPEPHEALRLLIGACDLSLKYMALCQKNMI